LRSARISASLQCSLRSHPFLEGRINTFTRGFGSLPIGGDTKSFSPSMALRCHSLFLTLLLCGLCVFYKICNIFLIPIFSFLPF
jgi:hypothetical protein